MIAMKWQEKITPPKMRVRLIKFRDVAAKRT